MHGFQIIIALLTSIRIPLKLKAQYQNKYITSLLLSYQKSSQCVEWEFI